MTPLKQLALIILDGWGYSTETKYNAIAQANPEYFNHLWETYPHTLFEASGTAVGLLPGIIGTSEIGHMSIGAGRVIDTDVVRVFKAIQSGEFNSNPVFAELFEHIKKNTSTLHVMGLVSPGGVHSHQDHLFAFLKLAKERGITNIAIHAFLDGRDTPPQSGVEYLKQLEQLLIELGVGKIASISGRYFAMDRDQNLDRTQKTEDLLFKGEGKTVSTTVASEALTQLYTEGVTDEFVPPTRIGGPASISENDGLFFFNFRPDRARQISMRVLEHTDLNLYFVTLTQYSPEIHSHVAFPPLKVTASISSEVSKASLTQVHIAETEKYAHVTYFLNGGNEQKHSGEEFVVVESRKDVPTHDLAPEMRAKEIADKALEYIDKGTNFLAINFANADMVGHSGKMEPTIQAIKTLDGQIKRVVEALLTKGGAAFITADHGNAEVMFDEKSNQPQTAHTLNPVPAILTMNSITLHDGSFADVAPTILSLFGIPTPSEMTGHSLVEEKV